MRLLNNYQTEQESQRHVKKNMNGNDFFLTLFQLYFLCCLVIFTIDFRSRFETLFEISTTLTRITEERTKKLS